MLLIFFVVVGFLIYYQYKKEKRLINLISVLSGPYWVLIPLNNLLVYKLGFLQISDDVILMLTVGLFCFFIGTLPVNNRCSVQNAEEENRDNLLKYNVSWMAFVVFIIALMGLLKLLSMFRSGAFDAVNVDEAEGVMGNGVVGHLMNFSYPSSFCFSVLDFLSEKNSIFDTNSNVGGCYFWNIGEIQYHWFARYYLHVYDGLPEIVG